MAGYGDDRTAAKTPILTICVAKSTVTGIVLAFARSKAGDGHQRYGLRQT
jgi:hypothetical protein